jgi:hypothetical protein
MSSTAKRKVTALAITLVYLTLLGLGSARPPYSKAVDLSLLGLHFAYMVTASISLVWNRSKMVPLDNRRLSSPNPSPG